MSQGGNKKNPHEEMSIDEIINKADILSRDHFGSRLIQEKYEDCSAEDKTRIFNKIKDIIYPLSKDIFGNYAIQKILDFKNEEKNINFWN